MKESRSETLSILQGFGNQDDIITIYQLIAVGMQANPFAGSAREGRVHSKLVYGSIEMAERAKGDFAKKVTTKQGEIDYVHLSPDGLNIRVVELELVEEPD